MTSPAASRSPGAERRRPQLPADVSGFVGRRGELARLAGLLDRGRLVTVAGPGGVGKTRLALRAAAAARPGDGSCLVELSGLTDPELLPDTVALRLGLHADTADRLDAVLGYLRDRELLLILDTCEHLTGACARFVTAVLHAASGVTVLATSRQPLHAPGEEVLRLSPLPVPGPDDVAGADAGSGDAVELFAQRAAAAVSGFTISAADRPHVIRLCRRLDGIPLAIELAAVRVRVLPVAELATRVEAGLAAGTGTRRGIVSRHQTLQAAIGWSFGLCTAAERAAWRRLAVFAGSFDLKVARDLVTGDEVTAERAGRILTGLVDKSVVLSAGSGRYRLLDSVREYGAEQLAAAGEDAEYRERHLTRYLRLVSEFSRQLVADGQRDRLARLRAEHANLRGALEFGLRAPRLDDTGAGAAAVPARAAARLAAALYPYWFMAGSIREGIHWLDKSLDRFPGQSPERASALANRALLATMAGLPGADAQAGEAIAMAARLADERTHARGYLALQFALATSGRYPEALEAAQQAQGRLEALGADHALLTLDMHFALTYVLAGDFDAALEHSEHLLRRLGPGERWLRGNAHALSALAYYPQPGRQEKCAEAARAALRAAREIGNLVGAAYSLEVLAWQAADTERYQRAAWLLGAAQGLWERAGGRLSGSAVLEGYHQRSATSVATALGSACYAELHAAGAGRPLAQLADLAIADTDRLPGPAARAAAGEAPGGPGDGQLTVREREIAALVARGLSNRAIAARLVISKRTVDAHVTHIFAKLGLSSRVQLTIWLGDQVDLGQSGALPPAAGA